MLAAGIVEALNADAALAAISAPPEIAGAGFINFRLKPDVSRRDAPHARRRPPRGWAFRQPGDAHTAW